MTKTNSIRGLVTSLLPNKLKTGLRPLRDTLFDMHAIKSYSQEGEDMILKRIFEGKQQGFYIDVGAHHPQRFSNTHYFYQRGWNGINIEPNPDAVSVFQRLRRRDTNVQCGVGEKEGTIVYYKFNEPALNTFDETVVEDRLKNTPYKLIDKIAVPVLRLAHLLEKEMPAGQQIDFMSVDVEGLDLNVLRSNDWQKYRPYIVLAEALDLSLEQIGGNELARFMKSQGYVIFGKTYNTLFFRDNSINVAG